MSITDKLNPNEIKKTQYEMTINDTKIRDVSHPNRNPQVNKYICPSFVMQI